MARLHGLCFTLPPPWSEAEIAATLAGRFAFALERPGGFLIGQALTGEAELLTLAVDPGLRRQGLGRALLADFMAEARLRGAETALLEVAEGNAPARGLYVAAGFVEVGRRRGYYRGQGRVEDAILMRRALT